MLRNNPEAICAMTASLERPITPIAMGICCRSFFVYRLHKIAINLISRLTIMASIYNKFRNDLAKSDLVWVYISRKTNRPTILEITRTEAYREFSREPFAYELERTCDGLLTMVISARCCE